MNDREWADHLEQSRQLQAARDTAAQAERELAETRRARQELAQALADLIAATKGRNGPMFDARTRAVAVLGAWGDA